MPALRTSADTSSMHYAESLLEEVIRLFPDRARNATIYPYHSRYLLLLKTLLPHLERNDKAKILDVGAGAGVIPLVLRKMGHSVAAIDTWEEYLEGYNNIMGTREEIIDRFETDKIPTKYCDIEKETLPFEDQSFDVVTFFAVIEHLHSSPKNALQEIRRVLKPNGILLLETVNLATLRNRIYAFLGRSNYTDVSVWFTSEPFFSHVREYTPGEVKRMLEWTGFEVEKVILSNCLHTPLIKEFKRAPIKLTVLLFYMAITTLVPGLRYELIEVARKGESL